MAIQRFINSGISHFGNRARSIIDSNFAQVSSENLVQVDSMRDFPEPVGGVITLEPNTKYLITGVGISTPYRFECTGNLSVCGLWQTGATQLTYTGSDTMFTVTDGNLEICELSFSCPSGTAFNVNNTEVTPRLFIATRMLIGAAASLGTVTDVFTDWTTCSIGAISDGLTVNTDLLGSDGLSMREVGFVAMLDGCTAIDLGSSVMRIFELSNLIFSQAAGTGTAISGAANSANMLDDYFGMISGCEFAGGVTPLNGLTLDDIRYRYRGNAGLDDSLVHALRYISGNSTATTITTQGVAVAVAGTWSSASISQMTTDTGSQVIYSPERSGRLDIFFTCSVDPASGSPTFELQLHKNGSPLTGAVVAAEAGIFGVSASASLSWLDEADEGDEYEIFIVNTENTTDLTVTDGTFKIRQLT